MKEIKFRAWDKKAHRMVRVKTIRISGDILWGITAYAENDYAETELLHAEFQLMQYTGLLDKHGTEIYEGDIVKLGFERYNKHETGEVYYDSKKACFGPFHHFINDEDRWFDVGYIAEVIGNIYENPDELEATKPPL